MYKLVTVIGARPQFVKAAVVSRALRSRFEEVVVHTGQHYDHELSGVFFEQLGMSAPTHNLAVGSGSHAQQTADALVRIEEVLQAENPDLLLIYGDTNSTLAAALAAVKLCLPIAHVEAGPRLYSWQEPEEVNRIVADRFAALLFCATRTDVSNLEREGIRDGVFLSGDVMLDLFMTMRESARDTSILESLDLTPGEYLLATVHRARNTDSDERLKSIFEAFLQAEEPVVLPLHPRTLKSLQRIGWHERVADASHIHLLEPLGYVEFMNLQLDSRMIITDSGGVCREAYFAGRPCLTLFPFSAWPETVDDGWNLCVDADTEKILSAIRDFSPDHEQKSVFGNGRASEMVADAIQSYLDDPRPLYA
jgi:UDP-N-acetylglucosamine 2-epimerase